MSYSSETKLCDVLREQEPVDCVDFWESLHAAMCEKFTERERTIGWLIDSTKSEMQPVACGARHAFDNYKYETCQTRARNLLCKHPSLTHDWLDCRLQLAGVCNLLSGSPDTSEYQLVVVAFENAYKQWHTRYEEWKNEDIMEIADIPKANNAVQNNADGLRETVVTATTEYELLADIVERFWLFLTHFDQCCHASLEVDRYGARTMVNAVERELAIVATFLQQKLASKFALLMEIGV